MKGIEQDALRTAGDHFAEIPSLEERVARIEARDRVEELLAHYARCVDAQDAQGVGAAFTEDGEMCSPGMPALKGRARITKLYGRLLPALRTSSHLIGAQQVLFASSERALVHAAFQAWDSYKADDALDCFSFGFYEVEAVREADGEWRMAALSINFAGQLEASADGSPARRRGHERSFLRAVRSPVAAGAQGIAVALGARSSGFSAKRGGAGAWRRPIGLMLNGHV